MSKRISLAILGAIAFSFFASEPLQAQLPPFWIYGQSVEERASTRIGYWRKDANAGLGEVVISYGRPPWKQAYVQQFDQLTKGKMWRMGDNYWTLLDTNLPVRFGETEIPVGLYYLAVKRSQDGSQWSLVFIDPAASRKKVLDSYDVGTRPKEIPILYKTPLKLGKSESAVQKLTILFKLNQGSQTEGTMRLSWGPHTLEAPVAVHLNKTPVK